MKAQAGRLSACVYLLFNIRAGLFAYYLKQ